MHRLHQPSMMSRKLVLAAIVTAFMSLPSIASAKSEYLTWLNGLYATSYSCSVCHVAFLPQENAFSRSFKGAQAGGSQTDVENALRAIESIDSDGDGTVNGMEIAIDFHPGYDCGNYLTAAFSDVSPDFVDPQIPGCVAAPNINVNPPTLDFVSVDVGMSATLLVNVENKGTSVLMVSAVNRCAGTSTEFSWTPASSFTVAPGMSQPLNVTYTPANPGTSMGCLQLASNDPDESLITLEVKGIGNQPPTPDINLDPPTLDLGDVDVGMSATLIVNVQNNGTSDLMVNAVNLCAGTSTEFSWTPRSPFTVAPGMSHPLNVTYTPTNPGQDMECLRLASNDPDENPITLDVMGNGIQPATPDINLDPPTLDFADVDVGMSASLLVNVQNKGTADLMVSAVNLCAGTSTEFSWTPASPFTVAPGMSHPLNVTYTPTNPGQDMECLRLASNDPDENPITLDVMGNGTQPATPDINLDPPTLDFADVDVGMSASLLVNVQNKGTADLMVSAVNLCAGTSTEFSWTPASPFTVAAGMSQPLNVTYEPTSPGQDMGCLQLASNDPDQSPISLDVAGNGIQPATPDINLDPPTLDFADVDVGMSASLLVNVQNMGTADLMVSAVNFCGGTSTEFSWASVVPFTVAPGMSHALDVTYAPGDANLHTECLQVVSNDPDESPMVLELTGNGVTPPTGDPRIDLDPAAVDFGQVEIGATETRMVQVQNLGTGDLQVQFIDLCPGTSMEYSWSPSSFTVPRGTSQALTVFYQPFDETSDPGCLGIQSNDPIQMVAQLDLAGNGIVPPTDAVDLDIVWFRVRRRIRFEGTETTPISIRLRVHNAGTFDESRTATVVGTQKGKEVYRESRAVSAGVDRRGATYRLPSYVPTQGGNIDWSLVVQDDDPDIDEAEAITKVRGPRGKKKR